VSQKQNENKRAGFVTQMGEYFPRRYKLWEQSLALGKKNSSSWIHWFIHSDAKGHLGYFQVSIHAVCRFLCRHVFNAFE
jgi:hypothetical protein